MVSLNDNKQVKYFMKWRIQFDIRISGYVQKENLENLKRSPLQKSYYNLQNYISGKDFVNS